MSDLLNHDLFRKRIPMVMQGEAAECGLACLCMILQHHGRRVSLHKLRKNHGVGIGGINISDLKDLASRLELNGRVVRAEMKDLEAIPLPAVIHWGLNHYVVMTSVGKKHIEVNDPACGRRRVSRSVFSKYFSGFILELSPSSNFEKANESPSYGLADIWRFAKQFKGSLKTTAILSCLAQIFLLSFPLFYHTVIDRVFNAGDEDLLALIVICFGILSLFHLFIGILRGREELYVGTNVIFLMTSDILRHLLLLPLSYFESRSTGAIQSRVTATRPIERMISSQFINAFVDIILSVIIIIILFLYNAKIASIILTTIFLYGIAAFIFYSRSRELERHVATANADEQSSITEIIQNIQTTKLYGQEAGQLSFWEKKYSNSLNSNIQLNQARIIFDKVSDFIISGNRIVMIFVATTMALNNEFTLGQFFAVFLYGSILISRVQSFVNVTVRFLMLSVRLERVSDILLEDSEFKDAGKIDRELKGGIEVENLQYTYKNSNKAELKDISFEIQAGEFVAFSGPSGCGKTTLLKLILGLYRPGGGKIYFDGRNEKKFDPRCLRRQISAVMQGDSMISGSIAQNIALFDDQLDIDRVKRAAKLALIDDEIKGLPMQYETLVRSSGGALSAGQRQRVLLARALYREPKILIMDEGTAYLDIDAEKQVNHNLRMLNITRIVVAHREDSIRLADRLFIYKERSFVEDPEKLDKLKSIDKRIDEGKKIVEAS